MGQHKIIRYLREMAWSNSLQAFRADSPRSTPRGRELQLTIEEYFRQYEPHAWGEVVYRIRGLISSGRKINTALPAGSRRLSSVGIVVLLLMDEEYANRIAQYLPLQYRLLSKGAEALVFTDAKEKLVFKLSSMENMIAAPEGTRPVKGHIPGFLPPIAVKKISPLKLTAYVKVTPVSRLENPRVASRDMDDVLRWLENSGFTIVDPHNGNFGYTQGGVFRGIDRGGVFKYKKGTREGDQEHTDRAMSDLLNMESVSLKDTWLKYLTENSCASLRSKLGQSLRDSRRARDSSHFLDRNPAALGSGVRVRSMSLTARYSKYIPVWIDRGSPCMFLLGGNHPEPPYAIDPFDDDPDPVTARGYYSPSTRELLWQSGEPAKQEEQAMIRELARYGLPVVRISGMRDPWAQGGMSGAGSSFDAWAHRKNTWNLQRPTRDDNGMRNESLKDTWLKYLHEASIDAVTPELFRHALRVSKNTPDKYHGRLKGRSFRIFHKNIPGGSGHLDVSPIRNKSGRVRGLSRNIVVDKEHGGFNTISHELLHASDPELRPNSARALTAWTFSVPKHVERKLTTPAHTERDTAYWAGRSEGHAYGGGVGRLAPHFAKRAGVSGSDYRSALSRGSLPSGPAGTASKHPTYADFKGNMDILLKPAYTGLTRESNRYLRGRGQKFFKELYKGYVREYKPESSVYAGHAAINARAARSSHATSANPMVSMHHESLNEWLPFVPKRQLSLSQRLKAIKKKTLRNSKNRAALTRRGTYRSWQLDKKADQMSAEMRMAAKNARARGLRIPLTTKRITARLADTLRREASVHRRRIFDKPATSKLTSATTRATVLTKGSR